jgi:hypothetical protein
MFYANSITLDNPLWWWFGVVATIIVLLVPVLLVEVPPILDYPNILAGAYVLAFGGTDPILHQMFTPSWRITPNLGVDLILPPLMHLFSTFTAGRIVVALALLLPVTGAVALSYAYFRRRSFWQIAVGIVAFNPFFLTGVFNFDLATGVALWGAAGWVAFSEEFPIATIAVGVVVATIAFFVHIYGFFLYALLIGTLELFAIIKRGPLTHAGKRFAISRILSLVIVMIIPAILFFLSLPLGDIDNPTVWLPLSQKIFNLALPIISYWGRFDVLIALPIIGFISTCIALRKATISPPALLSFMCVLACYAVLPNVVEDNFNLIDTRLTVVIALVFFAGIVPANLDPRLQLTAAVAIGILLTLKVAFVSEIWLSSQQDVADTRQVIAPMTPGSRVLVVDHATNALPPSSRLIPHIGVTYWHLAAFVLLDKHAFWSDIFLTSNWQLVATDSYRDAASGGRSGIANYLDLAVSQLPKETARRLPNLVDWVHKYDFVLLLNAEGISNLPGYLPAKLQFLGQKGIAALFRVKK